MAGSRTWKWTTAAPAAATASASAAHRSAVRGTCGFVKGEHCSLSAASMITFDEGTNTCSA